MFFSVTENRTIEELNNLIELKKLSKHSRKSLLTDKSVKNKILWYSVIKQESFTNSQINLVLLIITSTV